MSTGKSVDFPLLSDLSAADRSRVLDTGRDMTYAKRQHLFAEDELASGCWLIRSGRVAIQSSLPGHGPVTIQVLGPGELAGWSWLVPPHRWRFSGVALTDVIATVLDTDQLHADCCRDPEFGYRVAVGMLATVADRLSHTRGRLLELYRGNAGRRQRADA
jgi:CRP-like cAMP-binding protein